MYACVVLAVEDDAASIDLLKARLSTMGCSVVAASNPEEAVDAAIRHRPIFALVDLALNGTHDAGVQVVKALRQSSDVGPLPIVLHSIHVKYVSELPKALGDVDGLLPKPYRREELSGLIDRHRG